MMIQHWLSRRAFLAMAAGSAAAMRAQNRKHVPVGLLIYAVLADWNRDFDGTLTAVSKMGYEGLELTNFSSWTPQRAKEVRALMDSLKLKCFAGHIEPPLFLPGDQMKAMIELNHILGTQTISCVRGLAASVTPAANNPDNAGSAFGRKGVAKGTGGKKAPAAGAEIGYHPSKAANEADAWKELRDVLQAAAVTLKKEGFVLSFHNHAVEFQTRKNGVGRPIDILTQAPDLTFTTDVNVATRAGSDVVEFIKRYPGRTNSLLLTDGPTDDNGHMPALGKGDIPWKAFFDAAEGVGGLKFYLLTHSAADVTPMEAVKRDLDQYRLIHS
jgi:sugar phosphate isomerase/epimerase